LPQHCQSQAGGLVVVSGAGRSLVGFQLAACRRQLGLHLV
jgi:hypothetical protein